MLSFNQWIDESSQVQIQLQQQGSANWTTMHQVYNHPLTILKAMEELKERYPKQQVRALLDGMIVNIWP